MQSQKDRFPVQLALPLWKTQKNAAAGERPVLNNAKTIIEITIIIKHYEKSSEKLELP